MGDLLGEVEIKVLQQRSGLETGIQVTMAGSRAKMNTNI